MSHGIDNDGPCPSDGNSLRPVPVSSRLLTESRGAKSLDGDVVERRRRKKQEERSGGKNGRSRGTKSGDDPHRAADGNDGAADLP